MGVKQLLQLEYAKWRNNSVITILALLYMIMMPVVLFLAKEVKNLPDIIPSIQTFFIFPTVWDWMGYVGSWLSFFCFGLIAIFMIVSEVGYKTFRQNIITGMTKKEYFLGKIYAILGVSLTGTLYYSMICLISGFIHTKHPDIGFAFDNSMAILRYFLMIVGHMTMGMFVGFLIRKSGVTLLLYLIYVLMLESGIKWGLLYFGLKLNHPFLNYFPANVFEDLTPLPLWRFGDVFMGNQDELDFDILLTYSSATIAGLVWIAILLGVSYRGLLKRDM